jgi:hypothetical protein
MGLNTELSISRSSGNKFIELSIAVALLGADLLLSDPVGSWEFSRIVLILLDLIKIK